MAYVGKRSLGFPLVHLPGSSRGEDRLPMHREGIRMQKYLGKKLLPPHLMRYSSFPGRIYVEKTPEQCFESPLPPENQKAVREEVETQVPD